MYILTKRATDSLNRTLHLPATGDEQDWDIELADPTRIEKFLAVFNRSSCLDSEHKLAFMALIVASCDVRLQKGDQLSPDVWADVSHTLQRDPIYKSLIDYWSLRSEKREAYLFAITPFIRSIASGCSSGEGSLARRSRM